ncbi:HPF/RaiA family ribosome-associated protein [Antarcticibacterium sp. 1MA-6-2]|uniref:HPF/RaiA family ribosome-associated protein n=1 Tax=Antarcticibacterium sp. 1MA-6-2 TaxID=2908210 RepID=UPI001F1A109B|nr:HPF/RaiA family ribosome-associated protein [Antarcticibacterium sp. 1MA-6-2]UJH91603.1 HPF/RaiA family ribosome-associated protein [Antarcticibacterium sp. 1MA-6-2]
MDARFQYVKLERSESLEEFTQKKLDKLETKYDWIISAEVHFKRHEPEEPKGYICNISLSGPGPIIFAESNEESYEAAAAETVRDLEKQLSKRKGQMKSY